MASRYEVEVKISSANNLKNVNWRNGPNRPYVIVWVEPSQKLSTNVDEVGDTKANWDETLIIPLSSWAVIEDSTLFVDVVHAGSEADTKPIIGSAQLRLSRVKEDVGIGEGSSRTLKLKRPSGRPQGTVDVKVTIKDNGYRARAVYDAPAYGVPPPQGYSTAPPPQGYSATPPPQGYSAAPPLQGYSAALPSYGSSYSGYSAGAPYEQGSYVGQSGQQSYGYEQGGQTVNVASLEKKKSKLGGLGAGLAIGAIAGGLGALALGEGVNILEDSIANRAAEKVEEDMSYAEFLDI